MCFRMESGIEKEAVRRKQKSSPKKDSKPAKWSGPAAKKQTFSAAAPVSVSKPSPPPKLKVHAKRSPVKTSDGKKVQPKFVSNQRPIDAKATTAAGGGNTTTPLIPPTPSPSPVIKGNPSSRSKRYAFHLELFRLSAAASASAKQPEAVVRSWSIPPVAQPHDSKHSTNTEKVWPSLTVKTSFSVEESPNKAPEGCCFDSSGVAVSATQEPAASAVH